MNYKSWRTQKEFVAVYLFLLLLFNWTANGFLPVGSDTTIRQAHKITYITRNEYNTKK
jgi:hypothetical protein